jgi:hypothetical protein
MPTAAPRPRRLLKSDASPSGRDERVREKDAGSANSRAMCAAEDVLSRRPVRSGSRGFVCQQPPSAIAAVCGLYCGACTFYIGSQEDPERLAALAARHGKPIQDLYCDGCMGERRTYYCETCTLTRCAQNRGVDFCSQCGDYPCGELIAFESKYPHRIGLRTSLEMIRDRGWEAWEAEMKALYACPACGTTNSAYDLSCRTCGHSPGSRFAEENAEAVRMFLGVRRAEP